MSSPDFLFLLGAGASAEAGLPMASSMTEKFIASVKESGDGELVGALSLVLGGIHFLRGFKGHFPSPQINIEELAVTLDAIVERRTSQLSPFVGSWNDLLGRFDGSRSGTRDCIDELRQMLHDQINVWLITPKIGELGHFQQLRAFTKEYGRLDIFTLNYDLCVETALADVDVQFTCGVNKDGWDASLFQDSNNIVKLYKMHGSVDWYRDSEDGNVYSVTTPPEDRIPASGFAPLLIFGLANKLQAVDPFLHLSYTFSRYARSARVLVVIGYGFADDYINQMILQGFSSDSRKQMIVVSDTCESGRQALLSNFGRASVFVDAKRIRFLGEGCKSQLEKRNLLTQLKLALEETSDEGPFN